MSIPQNLLGRISKQLDLNIRLGLYVRYFANASSDGRSGIRNLQFYLTLIRQYTEIKSLKGLKNIQTQLVKGSYNVALTNKLIDALIKCGSVDDARKMFDILPNRRAVYWNSIISCYVSHGRNGEAIDLYEKMLSECVLPDAYTFSSIFKAFGVLGLQRGGQTAHGLSIVLGLGTLDGYIASALVDMYVKFERLKDAQLVFSSVVEKDVVLFTALIVGYVQHAHDDEAWEIFMKMINQGIKSNEYTLASILISCGSSEYLVKGKLIHSLIIKSGFESVVASQTSLLTMYSRCSLVDDSLKVFHKLANANQVTWTSLIAGLIENGREDSGFEIFTQMIRNSIFSNSFTLTSVLKACASLAILEGGKQIHAIVKKVGLDRDIYVGAALITLYGKCGYADIARSVFDQINELDLMSVNSMIYAYAQNNFGHEALQLFETMKRLGCKPNNVTYLSVLLACNNSGLVDNGCQIFTSIESNHDVELTRDHYTCMVDLLGRFRRLEEAEQLIVRVRNPDIVLWRTLLSACKIQGEVAMAERIVKRVLELAPTDEGTHVLLSNLYATTGNWNRLIEVKSSMRELKLKRKPAMSWVDVDREVHSFLAGDWSHPSSQEFKETLHALIEEVKTLGYVPDTTHVLQDMDEDKKVRSLYYHSEKLALAFALWKTSGKTSTIRVFKNLRVCGDCHSWIKFVSMLVGRKIIARDATRFHHFKDGFCSCGDYW